MNHERSYRQATMRYIGGAFLAALVTIVVYLSVTNQWFVSAVVLAQFALGFAIVQLGIQLLTFLHLGNEAQPRWQWHSFWFIFVMAAIIVVGSIWIMTNLDYNMGMSPQQMDNYMMQQNKKGF